MSPCSRLLFLISLVIASAVATACSYDSGTDLNEVLEPAVLPHEVWGRADLRYSGRGVRVAVMGDDILRTGEADLRRSLSGYAVKVAAIRGEGYAGGERSSTDPAASMGEIARAYGEGDPARVVIALGTNDLRPEGASHPKLMNAANAVFDQFEGTCIVGVTVDVDAPIAGFRQVRAGSLNKLIRRRSNRVVDWNAMTADRPELLSGDGFTPTSAGSEALVSAIRSNVEACV